MFISQLGLVNQMSLTEQRYQNSDYLEHNPTWDIEDSPWKASHVVRILNGMEPGRVCEVGCGAGGVLASLRQHYPLNPLDGYDISPHAESFWSQHDGLNINFYVGDFLQGRDNFDTILLLDVLEHVADPHAFLNALKGRADQFIIHFPLDLSAASVLRESPLLYVRRKVGHIHYFTRGLALELLEENGFEVINSVYTGAAFNAPQAALRTRLAQLPRRFVYAMNKDVGVRLLGGETLMVLARPR